MLGLAANKGRRANRRRNGRMRMRKFMLATTVALAFGWISPALASPGPASAAAIAEAAGLVSPAAQARCYFRRWCGPVKCHRRLWCP
jgi:hypothetical protein